MFSLKSPPSVLFLAKHYSFTSVCFEKLAVLIFSCLKTRFLFSFETWFLCLRKVKFLKTRYTIIRRYQIVNEAPLVGFESL